MTRLARICACLLLGAWSLAPALAFAQTADGQTGSFRIQNNDWRGAYVKQAAQRAQSAATDAAGSSVDLAQTPGAAPAQPATPPRGRVRIQGRDVPERAAPPPPPAGFSADLREQMRKFIQSISAYARRQNRNFSILTEGGLDLLVKRDPADETRIAPARAFMRSIDGIVVEGLNYGAEPVFGEPPATVGQAQLLGLADIAKENGLKVFVLDFTTDAKSIEDSYVRNYRRGFVSYAAPAPRQQLNALARLPARPYNENPKSILSIGDVRNYAYIVDPAAFGRQDEFAFAIHHTNYDLLITSVFHGRDPLTRQAVETLKFKQVGGKRLVFAVVDVGSAASYHYYWKPNWREGSPGFVGAPFRDDPDRYHVQYWQPAWQRLIAGDNNSYVYGVIAQGFDGVVLTGIETAYRFAEGGQDALDEDVRQRQQPAPKPQAAPPAPGATPAAPAPAATPAPTTPGR